MAKSPDAFRTISEVADWLGVQAHVLRFWESKFHQVKPVKRAGGRRYYRPSDMQLLGGIKTLLHDDGLTIKGVQKILRESGQAHVAALSPPLDSGQMIDITPVDATAEPETVVQFQARRARPEPPPPPASEQMGLDLGAPPEAPEPKAPEPRQATAGAESPAPAPTAEAANTVQDQTDLPSFLHRPVTAAPEPHARPDTPPDASPDTPPDTVSVPPRARVVDLPDPAADDLIDCVPGPLGRLAAVESLSPAQARDLAQCADALRGWLDRTRAAGAA